MFGILLAVFVVPAVVGTQIGKALRMPDHGWKMGLALGTILAAVIVLTIGQLREGNLGLKFGPDLSGGITLIYEVMDRSGEDLADDADATAVKKEQMKQMVDALVRRINPAGNKEVTIRQYGASQIEIIIPKAGDAELERVKRFIVDLGQLEFRITADPGATNAGELAIINEALELPPQQKVVTRDGKPVARWIRYNIEEFDKKDRIQSIVRRMGATKAGGVETPEALVLLDPFDVTGEFLSRTWSGADDAGNPAVHFRFDSTGANRFGRLTGSNLPEAGTGRERHLGIILNGELFSAPGIQERITEQGIIHGSFTQQEVEDLVGVLNAGSLPAELNPSPLSEEQISPTLGAATIEKGRFAIATSVIAVLIFMAIYYRFAGLVACLALVMNLVLVLGIMVLIQAQLSLPGLAGLVLTIGMSVDANVLIFERIREELDRGAALKMAIRNGFGRATRTIVDANLTTLLTGIVLYAVATDQIKGFAVTLILGIVVSMYTAIFMSRIVFDVFEKQRWLSKLTMMRLVGATDIHFISKQGIALAFSVAVILIGLIAVAQRGMDLLNIDFAGGVSVTMRLKTPSDQPAVRAALAKASLSESDLSLGERNLTVVERGLDGLEFTVNARFDDAEIEELAKQEKTPVDVVQEIITTTFGDKLDTYDVRIEDLQDTPTGNASRTGPGELRSVARVDNRVEDAITIDIDPATVQPVHYLLQEDAGAAEEAPAAEEAEEAAEPDAKVVEEEVVEEEVAAADEEVEQAESSAAMGEGPLVEPAAGRSTATLLFKSPIGFETVAAELEEAFQAQGYEDPNFTLDADGFISGSAERFTTWKATLPIDAAGARVVLDNFANKLNKSPVFPFSNRIGSRVAGQMQQLASAAIFFSLIGIVGYIWFRFQRVAYGLAAVVALVHDVLVTLGAIAISYYIVEFAGPLAQALQIESFQISLPIVAAFLTIIGYSLNDTIVVFDRIREVRGKSPELTETMINNSINQTLSRTLLTSLTTFVVVAILYAFGGSGIHGFAFALVVGVVVGTYSSIFVASPALLWMTHFKSKKSTR